MRNLSFFFPAFEMNIIKLRIHVLEFRLNKVTALRTAIVCIQKPMHNLMKHL